MAARVPLDGFEREDRFARRWMPQGSIVDPFFFLLFNAFRMHEPGRVVATQVGG